ncbi:succinate dehydrogenase assembly factor 2, mitochondrial-like [Hydractinia symbiolongicarpus]|uniref:succinate dehydrogenase assembly factor 2, mitochondrial-like n=1 Tax=Hydractinia symbiolongicarpus TaxID=13093 RepID=UPI00254DAD34|nr:succinate dehydrogenase assembly factor 2, mitochondrial-like [Hydractinia symbiolongicarpus]XP_057293873.1 succinate dehydrogenase assembly factor 2, mitochondrial-like [Hydractinia symbiolongicarpus]
MKSLVKYVSIRNCLILRRYVFGTLTHYSSNPVDFPDMGPPIPVYKKKANESIEKMKARLLYQSRKRGMTENGLILSNFAAKHLNSFTKQQLDEFDVLINKPSNDWDIFYWIMEKDVTPDEYNTEVMNMLKKFTRNEKMELRYCQPDLQFENK